MSTNNLTFLGPKNVLVDQPLVLIGTFDPQQITTVSLIAADQYPLDVMLNRGAKIWYVNLNQGFNQSGSRQLQLQGKNSSGAVVSTQTINLTVNIDGVSTGFPFALISLQETVFKLKTTDSSTLKPQEKVILAAGQTLGVNRYELVGNHLKVELSQPLSPVGQSGYFFEKHIQLTKATQLLYFDRNELPPTLPGTQLLWITQDTWIKNSPRDSSQLNASQKFRLNHGETYTVLGYAAVADHFQVTLKQPIPGFGNTGYVYRQHLQLFKEGQPIAYDANAMTLSILNTTAFKKQPIDAAYLQPDQKVTLPGGKIYGVAGYTLENSHLKVTLTENIPGFGNTGYLFLDFIQLMRGNQPFNPAASLSYQGPTEILINQPAVLKGKFDPAQTAKISLMAEDRYPLNVSLNRDAAAWQVSLDKGFQAAGARWLRLKAIDSQGNITGSQVIYITVSSDPLTVGDGLSLKVNQDTFFKIAPVDSANLDNQQKVLVKAGQSFKVIKYGFLSGHVKVLLESEITPVGAFGYFYEDHIQLSKGEQTLRFALRDVPDTQISAQMLVIKTTQIKANLADSANLAGNQMMDLLLGQTLAITGYACVAGHFRVTLAESIPGFGNVGYIYAPCVKIKKGDTEIPYDADAITLTVGQATVLKKRPVDAADLGATDKVTLPMGRVYGVSSYGVEENHIKVSLTEELPNFGNTGYVYPGFVRFQRGGKTFDPIPNSVEINVPYFSQLDNPRFYWSTCNVTSIAMVMYYYGVRPRWSSQLEDELLQWCFNKYGQGSQLDHSVLSALIRAYNFKTDFSTTRRWSELKSELMNQRPVVLAGDFTSSGHIITVIGYTPNGYIVNDPWGNALSGYSETEGARLIYPYRYLEEVAGPDGNVWAHFIRK